jgi:Cdc6-like AAA superfamily ATPase
MAAKIPWISIPQYPQLDQVFAFGDREEQVASLYRAIVDAGNAVVAGQLPTPVRYMLSGYKGVGKSSLLVQVLRMLRDPSASHLELPQGLPEPDESHRWLVIRVSGKLVRDSRDLADSLQRMMLSVLSDVAQATEVAVGPALKLPLFSSVLARQDKALFEKVRSALLAYTLTVDFVRAWRGAHLATSMSQSARRDVTKDIDTFLKAQIEAKGVASESVEGRAALGLSAGFIGKWSQSFETKMSIEQEILVSADLAIEALNALFKITTEARLPTILAFDDVDELVSGFGNAHAERARALMLVLGFLGQVQPTCFVLALRQEYQHEDLGRYFRRMYVSPATRTAAGQMLDAWTRVQSVEWSDEMRAALRAAGDRFVAAFDPDAPVVIPAMLLQLAPRAVSNARDGESPRAQLLRFLRMDYDGETARAVLRLAAALSTDDVQACAEATPLDPAPYNLTASERLALERSGLIRPAAAWFQQDPRVVLDPLIAYVRTAPEK